MRTPIFLMLALAACPLPGLHPSAQGAAVYSLQGAVQNEEKRPLAGVEILFIDGDSRALVKSVLSDGKGRYLLRLPAGRYEIRFRKANHGDRDLGGVQINADAKLPTVQLPSREWDVDGGNGPGTGYAGGKDCN